jgi:YVTN family beta-propeller protein
VPAAATGEIGPSYSMTANGRLLAPAGAMTTLGVFPTGGALTPDGKFYWAANSGGGSNDVSIVDTATGAVVQTLPLPGAYGGVAFTPSGTTAYVSGEAKGSPPTSGPTTGDAGDVIHVFSVNTVSGLATELAPIAIPRTGPGSGQVNSLPPVTAAWPDGLAVSPDGTKLVVALNQADNAAIVDLAAAPPTVETVRVGAYPAQVAFDPAGRAYVSNEEDGTISVIDPAAGTVTHTISGLGGPRGDKESHPAGMLADPARPRLYVAVANRDTVAVINTTTRTVTDRISVARPQGLGAAPVSLGIAPDGATLYSADAGEDAVAAIALTNRPGGPRRHHVIGKIPTAAYPTDVKITPDGLTLVWLAGKGLGAGPNPGYLFSGGSPYGSYVLEMLNGRLGRLVTPTDAQIQTTYTPQADAQVRPANAASPPAGTPVVGPHGGPSRKIKHVFYIVRENRTYDQIFGTDPRGDGEPALELFDDNGVAGPTGGVTPNAHALSRTFPLLDHVYANSEVSVDGHLITAGSYATDYVQRATAANYSGRGRAFDFGVFPVTFGPNYFIFDEAVRRNVSFRNYGEQASGISPTGNDGRPTYAPVVANTDVQYPGNLQIGCSVSGGGGQVMAPATCTQDSWLLGPHGEVTAPVSRFNDFRANFAAQVLTGRVPRLNYLILPNDHTNGTTPNGYTPKALMADNDLALGQVVDLVSHSPIWKDTAIFVVEDDSQDGADHVDAHRMPAFVVGPCAKRGGVVVDTRYDQYSVLRTIGLILGLKPLSLNDGLATPMYDAFDNTSCDPAGTRYSAIEPEQSLHEINSPIVLPPDAALSAAIFRGMDRVPQAISDRILWHSVHGAHSTPPAPGPNASLAEHARADSLLRVLARHGDVKAWLAKQGGDDD